MSDYTLKAGTTDVSVYFHSQQALVAATPAVSYLRQGESTVTLTPSTELAAENSAHVDNRWKVVGYDAGGDKFVLRYDLPDAVCAAPAKSILLQLDHDGLIANATMRIDLVANDPTTGAVASVTGDVAGKVLGGGAGTITGVGARVHNQSGDSIPSTTNLGELETYLENTLGEPDDTIAADIAAINSGRSVSAFLVDDDHTWRFNNRQDVTSPQLVNENTSFIGLVSLDFSVPMPANGAIASINSASFTNVALVTEPTVSSSSISADLKQAHVLINCTSATAATHTLNVSITTTDSQTFVRKGRLVLS